MFPRLPRLTSIAMRSASGIAVLSSCSRLPTVSCARLATPVTLAPGWARLVIKPRPTGSATSTITIGMVSVACLTA